ncbi:hypothetical protein Ddye_002613 [Dipteronia dyeriana]|uniref:Uncharacterized protein n=1 Tax=Dipteronia dyeriana TaxID=168575 RepID=A0AAD9XQR8_9ROSI|nr:hypothetical protein Ddye_002613 [Dipteronia dyeriana]
MKMKKMMVAVTIVLLLMSSQMDTVHSDAFDCLDACQTGCVQPDTRLMQRCDRKCQIKCDSLAASQVQEEHR